MGKFIPYGKQSIDIKDKNLIIKSLSNDLITTGPFVDNFENSLKKYLKCKYAYVCNSGTSAIHLAMLSLGLKKKDVVLMPAINFIASYNMAKTMGLRVFLVDVDKFTGQVTPKTVLDCIKEKKLKKVSALIVMFNGGYPENSENFYKLKKKYNFSIIEDACHAFGAKYSFKKNSYKVGSCKHSDISTFSMHPLKTITSGEGGIVTTNKTKIANNIKLFRNHGILRKKKYWKYDVVKTGFNYRLSDINCALGLSQLKKIDFFLKKRKKIYKKYFKEFKQFNENLKLPYYSQNNEPSFHLFIINIDFKKLKKNKDHFIEYLFKNKIISQQHYIPIYKFSTFKESKQIFPGADKYFKNSISIPIFVNLKKKEQEKVVNLIKYYFKKV